MCYSAEVRCGFYAQRIGARSLRTLKVKAKAWANGLTYEPCPPVEMTVYRYARIRKFWQPVCWRDPNGAWHEVIEPTLRSNPREERLLGWADLRR